MTGKLLSCEVEKRSLMQAAVIQAPLRMGMESRPPPLLGPGEVLVGVKSVGVCAGPIV